MKTCPKHGTALNDNGKCFRCEHPEAGNRPLLGGEDVVFPPFALGGQLCPICGKRKRLYPDGRLECFWCKYPSRDVALVTAENDAAHAMLLKRDAAWSKAIGSVIGYDAEACGSVTPEHMRQLVEAALHRELDNARVYEVPGNNLPIKYACPDCGVTDGIHRDVPHRPATGAEPPDPTRADLDAFDDSTFKPLFLCQRCQQPILPGQATYIHAGPDDDVRSHATCIKSAE